MYKDTENEQSRRANEQQYTILCIDDESVNLKILAAIFKDNYQVIVCKSAEQGFQRALQDRPDIILLDIVMPEENGFELMAKLKQHHELAAIPVIFITGLHHAADEEKGLKMGACDYIQKPFNSGIVRARVNTHLEIIRQRNLLQRFALFDSLTELPNHRKWQQDSLACWLQAQDNQSTIVYGIIDIDFFKQYNDQYGHPQGDVVLRQVAQAVKRTLFEHDGAIYRCGGEEFYFYLPFAQNADIATPLNACLESVRRLAIPHQTSTAAKHVTISIGAVALIPKKQTSLKQAIAAADEQLYLVKNSSRNALSFIHLPRP